LKNKASQGFVSVFVALISFFCWICLTPFLELLLMVTRFKILFRIHPGSQQSGGFDAQNDTKSKKK
jgi:hypothetical protein